MATVRPPPQYYDNEREIVTQFGTRINSPSGDPSRQGYRYLRLDWSEDGERFEYTLRYNSTRRGFWISASPHRCKDSHLFDSTFSFFFFSIIILCGFSKMIRATMMNHETTMEYSLVQFK